ncbi:MAG TPA: hypothetical protein VJP45_08225 [Candidatus Limnocylindria bacterium]|nr:hypothetical protein [Candidatus Limnocylindria bacterium]
MSPASPRPATVRVLEWYEDDKGQCHLWVRFGALAGSPMRYVVLARGAIESRKLAYGYAHLEVDTVEDIGGSRRVIGEPRIVDDSPTARDDAIAALLAEHLDRWEQFGEAIDDPAAAPPPRPSSAAGSRPANWTRRSGEERDRTPPERQPRQLVPPVLHRPLTKARARRKRR